MNSKELWNKLEEMTNKEIQMTISMCITYLEKNRLIDFKDILKDIKGCRKYIERGR